MMSSGVAFHQTQRKSVFVMTRIAKALLCSALLLLPSCQGQSPALLACETLDEVFENLYGQGDLDIYVASTERLAEQVRDANDQLLRDVGTSLHILAVQWREAGYADEQLRQANLTGVNLLNDHCLALRG